MTTPLKVHGADVSHHQGTLDLHAAKRAGLQFLYHKATEGNGFRDTEYAGRRVAAKAAGVPFGAYHFARASVGDAEAEAAFFLSVAKPQPGDLLPCLDLETTEGLSMTQLRTWAQTFAATVRRIAGCGIVLYSPWALDLDVIRWVPRYNRDNRLPAIGWDIWQFSGGAEFPGTPSTFPGLGAVDLNTFAPGMTLDRILIPAEKPEPQPAPPPPAPDAPTGTTLASFNIYEGNKAPSRNVAKMLKAAGNPDGVALQEASRWQGDVRGYKVIRATDDPEPDYHGNVPEQDALSSIVLVPDRATVRKVEARQVPDGDWSWNKPRVGRVWLRVVYELDGTVREVWSIHRCPGGPVPGIVGNRAAWEAEHRFLAAWVWRVKRRHPNRPIYPGGDWNTWPGKMPDHEHSIESLADELGADMHLSRIDGFLSINAPESPARPKGKPRKVKVRKLVRKFGSDAHRPVVVKFP